MVMMMMVSAVAGAGMAGAGVVAGAMGSVGIVCPIAKTDKSTYGSGRSVSVCAIAQTPH